MTQLTTRFLADNAVIGSKIRLNNAEAFRARNAANTADISLLLLTASNLLEFQTLPYVNSALPIPQNPKQLATIEYFQNYIQGKQQAKNSVEYLSTTNITATFTAGNGTTGATLVGTSQLVIDGKSFTATDVTTPYMRIGVIGQTAGLQRGIYDLIAASNTSFTLQRSIDFDDITDPTNSEVTQGAYFLVVNGTAYSGYECILTTPNPIVVDTTALNFASYPSTIALTAGDGLSRVGNTFQINLLSLGGLVSTTPGLVGGQIKVYTDNAALEQDKTITINGAGAIVAKKSRKYPYVLTATDVTNGYFDLPDVASTNSVDPRISGAPPQFETTDFTVNYTGGTGGKTRVTFTGGLATGGVSAVVTGDIVETLYSSF